MAKNFAFNPHIKRVKRAMDAIERHDNIAGNSPALDEAYEHLQSIVNVHEGLTPKGNIRKKGNKDDD